MRDLGLGLWGLNDFGGLSGFEALGVYVVRV